MANINDNIRTKKLYKSGETVRAYKDFNGEIVVPSRIASDIASIADITDVINDGANYENTKYFLKEIENIRLDLEELHAFIKDAFGKDSTTAASKGETGATGATGATGPQGPKGDTGATGNSHLGNVDSISFDEKSNQLIITIEKNEFRFNPAK